MNSITDRKCVDCGKPGVTRYCCLECRIERIKKTKLKWLLNNREKRKEVQKKYREAHPEAVKESSRKHRVTHKEERREYNQAWITPEKIVEYNHARRDRKGNGKITASEFKQLLDKYGRKCMCCKRSDVKLELDHVIPLKLGGSNTIDNAQVLCRSCNARKNARTIDYR